jgi:hypothetical protein
MQVSHHQGAGPTFTQDAHMQVSHHEGVNFLEHLLRILSLLVTSVPVSRDAPCNETNRRYFEFK